jgi:hypothetical protein
MRTNTSNLVILSAETNDKNITGTAVDGDIFVNFTITNTEVNQRIFVTEASLVVTGNFKLAQTMATIDMWITNVIAIVALPEVEPVTQHEAQVVPTKKRGAKKAAQPIAC